MARQIKGLRKMKSLSKREVCLKYLTGVFQKAYVKAQGNPQERFELACKHTDDVIIALGNKEPQKKSFYMLVVEDFKQHLLNLVSNEELIESAVETTHPEGVQASK